MKTITTFEDGKKVSVERYDGELKVGERKLYMSDYILSLTEELPIADIVSSLIDREEELEEYFNSLDTDESNFSKFLVHAMRVAESRWLINNSNYMEFVRFAISKVDLVKMEPESIEKIFQALLRHVKILPEEAVYADLLYTLLERAIKDSQKQNVIERIFPVIIKMARTMDSPMLKELFDLMVPHVDGKWLLDAAERSAKNEPIVLLSTAIPKNCVFMSATTNTTNYVLEIPKSQLRVKFHDIAYENVGHPRLLSIVSVSGNNAVGMKFFAVNETGDINDQTPLFRYPFSNVYENGNVCWSGYSEVEIKSVKDIEMLPLMFLSTTNNTHLNNKVRELFAELSGKEFPEEMLAGNYKKLKDVL